MHPHLCDPLTLLCLLWNVGSCFLISVGEKQEREGEVESLNLLYRQH